MKSKSSGCPKGFTLIEMIVTLVIVAVLGSMFYVYFGKGFTESVTPVNRLKQSTALHRVMQNITADYNVYPKWRAGTLYFKDTSFVIPRNFNGLYYQCTKGGTSSSTSEPAWDSPLSDGTVVDGDVTWKKYGRLRDLVPLYNPDPNKRNLQKSIGTEGTTSTAYGANTDGTYTTYTVVTNRFIKLDGGIESDDTAGNKNILKVTLKNDQGETLTAIFYSDKIGE